MGNRPANNAVKFRQIRAPGAIQISENCIQLLGVEQLRLKTDEWTIIENTKTSLLVQHKDFSSHKISMSAFFSANSLEHDLSNLLGSIALTKDFSSQDVQHAKIYGNESVIQNCTFSSEGQNFRRISSIIDNGYPLRIAVTYIADRKTFQEATINDILSGLRLVPYEKMEWKSFDNGNYKLSYPYGYYVDNTEELLLISPLQILYNGKQVENISIQEIISDKSQSLSAQMKQIMAELAQEFQNFKKEKIQEMIMCNGKQDGLRAKVSYLLKGRKVKQTYYLTGSRRRYMLIMFTSTIGEFGTPVVDRIARSVEPAWLHEMLL
jgi:hypothetical protein